MCLAIFSAPGDLISRCGIRDYNPARPIFCITQALMFAQIRGFELSGDVLKYRNGNRWVMFEGYTTALPASRILL